MNEILERLKTDRLAQLIVAGLFLMILILFFIFKPLIFPKKSKTELPCYQANLKLWLPFEENDVNSFLKDFTKLCVKFEIETKSLEDIKNDLVLALAENKQPDIIFIDNEFLSKYPHFFATPTPVFIDSLVGYYNQDILNFLNLEKPKTLDDLKAFIQKIRSYRSDFYPVGLGTKDIRHRGEIILSLMSLNQNFKNKENFRQNILSALEIYKNFSNFQSDFFSYPLEAGDDLINFANEKSALYIGFYNDKKEILSVNPRINMSFDIYPLNTFPPKAKIYSKVFYLAPLKKSRYTQVSQNFISWFSKYQLNKFAQNFDLIPFDDNPDLPAEKRLIINSAKNFGETFDFLDKKVLFDNIDRILNASDDELNRIIEQLRYSL